MPLNGRITSFDILDLNVYWDDGESHLIRQWDRFMSTYDSHCPVCGENRPMGTSTCFNELCRSHDVQGHLTISEGSIYVYSGNGDLRVAIGEFTNNVRSTRNGDVSFSSVAGQLSSNNGWATTH